MKLRMHQNLLITCDLDRLRVYEIDSTHGHIVRVRADRAEPTAINPFSLDESGEWVTHVQNGLFARSFTPPEPQDMDWTRKHSWIGLYDLALDEVARWCAGLRLDDTCLALSPDGERLAGTVSGEGVIVFHARSGEVLFTHPGSMGSGTSWSPDGRYIAAGDTDQSPGALYLLDLGGDAGVVRRELPRPSSRSPLYDSPYHSAFSPDGALVAFSNAAWGMRGVTVYEVESGAERWSVAFEFSEDNQDEEHWEALDVAFIADGAVLLAGLEDGVRAWSASDGTPLTTLVCPEPTSPWFTPDPIRRRLWFTRDDEPGWEPWPDDWA